MEAWAAGTVGGHLSAHAASLVTADAGVGGTAGQLGVCVGERVLPLSRARPGLRGAATPRAPTAHVLPMLQSSSSEPSPQSSNMLQRSDEERQRWFRHRNAFLSLQWEIWAVGDSRERRGFRLGTHHPAPPPTVSHRYHGPQAGLSVSPREAG